MISELPRLKFPRKVVGDLILWLQLPPPADIFCEVALHACLSKFKLEFLTHLYIKGRRNVPAGTRVACCDPDMGNRDVS